MTSFMEFVLIAKDPPSITSIFVELQVTETLYMNQPPNTATARLGNRIADTTFLIQCTGLCHKEGIVVEARHRQKAKLSYL